MKLEDSSRQLIELQTKLRKQIGKELYKNNYDFKERTKIMVRNNIKAVPAKLVHKIFHTSTTREKLRQLQESVTEGRKYYTETISQTPRYQVSESIINATTGLTQEDASLGIEAMKLLLKSPNKIENFPEDKGNNFRHVFHKVSVGVKRIQKEKISLPDTIDLSHLEEMNQRYEALLEQSRYMEYIREKCELDNRTYLQGTYKLSRKASEINQEIVNIERNLDELQNNIANIFESHHIKDGFDGTMKRGIRRLGQILKGLLDRVRGKERKKILEPATTSPATARDSKPAFVERIQEPAMEARNAQNPEGRIADAAKPYMHPGDEKIPGGDN